MYSNAQETETGLINALYDGRKISVPADLENRHYAEMKALEAAGDLTITPYAPPTQAELDAALVEQLDHLNNQAMETNSAHRTKLDEIS